MFKCLTYFSCEDGMFIKGVVYNHLPNNSKYHGLFEELDERITVEVSGQEVETAAFKPRGKKRKK